MVSYFDKGLRRRDVVDVPCYMNILPKTQLNRSKQM